MLSTSSVSYQVGNKVILKNINAAFMPGEFNMILGQNGSGKSSFLKIFSGEISRFSGSVSYNNMPLSGYKKAALAKIRAVMSQQPELSFPLTVEEVVMMGRYPHFEFSPARKDVSICNEVMNRMNLESFRERNYLTLSGGEKQRVQYARVLAQIWPEDDTTRYLFLDEPLTSLDIAYQQEFLEIARELKSTNMVLIAVMHDLNLAAQYGDKLFFLKEGELVATGSPANVLSTGLLEKVFGVKTTIIPNPVTGLPLVIYHSMAR